MKLTERQRDVLTELNACGLESWSRPLDVGGHSHSYHSAVLNQLARKGLAEIRNQPAHMMRPPKYYKITRQGRVVLAN